MTKIEQVRYGLKHNAATIIATDEQIRTALEFNGNPRDAVASLIEHVTAAKMYPCYWNSKGELVYI